MNYSGIASLVPQLKLSTHMWMALHAYRRSPAGAEMMHAVAKHVEGACDVLDDFLYQRSLSCTNVSPRGKTATGSGPKATRSASRPLKRGRLGADAIAKDSKTVSAAPRMASLNTGDPAPCDTLMAKRLPIVLDLEPVLGLIRRCFL